MDELLIRINDLLTNPLFKSVVSSSEALQCIQLPGGIQVFKEDSPQRRVALALTGQVPTPALVEIDGDFTLVDKMPDVIPPNGETWSDLERALS